MNKRFYAMIALAIALVLPILMLSNYTNTGADPLGSGEYEGFLYTFDGTDATITEYTGSLTDIEIPGEVNGKTVVAIGNNSFGNKTFLNSVIIPDSVTSIGGGAFNCCVNLTTVSIGGGVESIGGGAFNCCIGLTSVIIPDNVRSLDNAAFMRCANLTSISLGNGVEFIGSSAFSECASLTSVEIPDSVKIIDNTAFSQCKNLSSVTIGSGVESIGNATFMGCTNLSSVTIKNGVGSILNATFSECTSLTSIDIPDSVESIGSGAFSQCTSLASVIIGDGVTSVGGGAFYGCTNLSSVIIGDGVETIDNQMFSGCTKLSFIIIGNSVKSIGDEAFLRCTSLTSVEIPDSVKTVGNKAFYHCTNLSSVIIGDSVESIGDETFFRCTNLSSVIIGNSVESIGERAFQECAFLASIEIPDSVKSIEGDAFAYCTSLASVTIGNGVTSIGKEAFYECTGLESVIIGNSVESIDKCAFYLCANLVSVIIPDSVNSIGDSAFQVCFSLDNIRFLGDAPAVGSTWTHAGMTIYYYEGTAGFDQSAPGWNDLALRELTILDVTGADVSDISDHIYTSKSIRPGFTVTLEETIDSVLHVITLVNGVDYAVLYTDNINVGTATVTITGIGNYSGSVIGNFEITKKEIMVTPDDGQSKVYGEADPELTYTLSDETARASLSGALGRITDDGAGTYAITLGNLSAGNNYKLILVDADFTITKAPLTVTAEDKSVTFPNPFTAYTVMYSGFVGTDSESDLGGILNFECAYNGSAFAATFTIGPSGLTSANYEITFTAGTLNVNKANVATPKGISNITYDGTPQIGVLGDAGYTLTGRTAINAGNYTATATLNDGYIWSGGSIDPAEISWSIAPMTVTVIPNALSKVYGGGDPVLTYTLSKELNVAVTGTLQRDAGEDVGSYLIKLSKMSAGSNYSLVMVDPAVCFEITERDLSAAAVNAADQIYNGSPMEPDTVVTLDGITLDEGTDYTISYTDNMIAGTATVTVTGAGNYEGEAVGTFLIARKTVTVTPDAGQSKIFGSGDPVLTYTLSETVSMTGALSREGDDNIGTYLIILGTLSAGDNYDLILETADFLINKANQIVSSEGYTGIYDGASHGIAVTHNGTISYSTDGMTYGTDPLTYINAGTYTVYFKVIKANHTDYVGSETVLITKATLTATYGGGTAVFGSPPALTVSVTGFVNGETALTAAGYTAPAATNINANAGTYMLTPSGGAAANYVFSCVAGNLIVVPQELTITPAAGQTMTYTGSAPVSLTFAETLPDGVAAAGALTIGTVCDAGTYKILKGTLASDSPNYVFAVDETVDYVISPKDVTVTPDALSKAYNQADPVLTYALSEAIDVTGSLSRDSGDDIGTYVILMDTLEPVSGNYVLAMVVPSVTFEIKGIYIISFDSDEGTDVDDIIEVHGAAVTAPSNPTKTGCTFKEWTLSGSPYTFSTMPAENIELKAVWTVVQYTITFDPDEGTAVDAITGCYESTVTPPADPTRAGHRFGGWSPAVPATMPAEDMTVTAVWKTIVDAPAPVTDLTYDGSAQTGVLSGTGYTLSGYIATSARTHTATATLSSGYIWSDGTDEIKDVYWTISQKEIIVTPVVLSKVYGEADPELTYTLSEPIPVTGSLSRTAGEGAGTYAMTLGSLEPVLGNYILTLAPSDFEIVAEGTEDAGSTEVGITESNAMILLEIGAAVLAVVIAAMVLRRQ